MEDREYDLVPLRSSVLEMDKMQKSAAWGDICSMVKSRIEQKHRQMESAPDVDVIRTLQGEISECRFFIEVPDVLITEIEMRENQEKGAPNDKNS